MRFTHLLVPTTAMLSWATVNVIAVNLQGKKKKGGFAKGFLLSSKEKGEKVAKEEEILFANKHFPNGEKEKIRLENK